MDGKKSIETDISTEEKIKEAARKVFTRKGYGATRTRDIAEESGYNLALINYYFRSKEKLFDIIMVEALQTFVSSITGIINDRETSLQEKIAVLISHYIDMLIENPDLPIFIFQSINSDPQVLIEKVGFREQRENIFMARQFMEFVEAGNLKGVNPMHMVLNLLSMTVFPFVASPMIRHRFGLSIEEYNTLMTERKQLIPVWINAILGSHNGIEKAG